MLKDIQTVRRKNRLQGCLSALLPAGAIIGVLLFGLPRLQKLAAQSVQDVHTPTAVATELPTATQTPDIARATIDVAEAEEAIYRAEAARLDALAAGVRITDDHNIRVRQFALDNQRTDIAATAQAPATMTAVANTQARLDIENQREQQLLELERANAYFSMAVRGFVIAFVAGLVFGSLVAIGRHIASPGSPTALTAEEEPIETDDIPDVYPAVISSDINAGSAVRVRWRDYGDDPNIIVRIAKLVVRDGMFRTTHYQTNQDWMRYKDYVTFREQFIADNQIERSGRQYILTVDGEATARALSQLPHWVNDDKPTSETQTKSTHTHVFNGMG